VFHSAASVLRAQWQLTIDLSIDLLEHMHATRWLVGVCFYLHPSTLSEIHTLRRRGALSGSKPLPAE